MLQHLFDQNKYIYLYYNTNFMSKLNKNVDFIVLLNCPQNKSGSCIFVDDTVYILESGLIGVQTLFKSGHVVTGLKCDDMWYIYDSNNIIFECKWFLNNCNTYLKKQYPTWTLTNLASGGQIDTFPPQIFYKYEYKDENDCYFNLGGIQVVRT